MHRAFVVSDIRWQWSRALVVGAFNIPRKTGTRRVVGGGRVEIKQTIDRYAYARASLDDKTGLQKRWTAHSLVERVLSTVAEYCIHGWRIESFPADALTVENLDLADGGDVAIQRALAHAPGAMVRVDKDGYAVVFDGTYQGLTRKEMEDAGPRTDAGQIERLVDLKAIRPRAIRVHFERDVELRFDATEEDDGRQYAVDEAVPEMTMENVLPLPDPETTIDKEKVAQGTWVSFSKIIPVWSADASQIDGPPLTFENIRKYWFNLEGQYSRFEKLAQSSAEKSWLARIAAIKAHYRQTYRINPDWMRHIRDLRPTRVGVLDPVTGTRSPSMAWSQYAVVPSDKAKSLMGQFDPNNQFVCANVNGYPRKADGTPNPDGELYEESAAPAVVDVLDRELGILRINYRTDPHGMRSSIVPSMLRKLGSGDIESITRNLKDQLGHPIAFGCQVSGCFPVFLADDFRAAVIVTARPFGPNGKKRCFMYEVTPDLVKKQMASSFLIHDGDGPTWNLYCPPTVMSAWYSHAKTIDARESAKALFGFSGEPPEQDAPGYVLVNMMDGSDSMYLLPAVAVAMAVSTWAQFINQIEGSPAFHLDPNLKMVGNIEAIRHRLDPDGRLLTFVDMPAARKVIDALALLPSDLRSKILGTIPETPA
jgi:hypothetical protein